MTKFADRDRADLGALADEESGQLISILPSPKLTPPAYLELDGERLVYAHFTPGSPMPEGKSPTDAMLRGFVELVDSRPEQILAFARQWGVLETCAHDRGPAHGPNCLPRILEGFEQFPTPLLRRYWEPLDLWRSRALKAGNLLRLAIACQENREVADEGTEKLLPLLARTPAGADRIAGQRLSLSGQLSFWLQQAGVSPAVMTTGDGADVFFNFEGLDGAVPLMLLGTVNRWSFALCSGCGRPFQPKTHRRDGEKAWCVRCKTRGTPEAAASKAYRDRQKIMLKLHSEGMPVEEIARRLGAKTQVVQQAIRVAGARRGNKKLKERGRRG